MTAKSRARKLRKKWRNSDDHSKALKPREAQEAQPAYNEPVGIWILPDGRIHSVGFGRFSGKYTIERVDYPTAEEALYSKAPSHTEAIQERSTSAVEGQSSAQQVRSYPAHQAWFEEEVNNIPSRLATMPCHCFISEDHWIEL